ncbi:MAG TPA: polysaccharide biosynthesis protein, partial [Candidatus Methylomirabilis sp.]|nr:polysaccharide biosynthesis protein [Candidatus Methylomirabilis sp.]
MAVTVEGPVSWPEASVLVTGGTGSFGNKFVEIMLAKYRPRRLCIVSRDELKQSEMAARWNDPSLRFFIGDVRDRERLLRAMHGVDIVFHAAALKQIPACEYNPFEAIQTNVLGAKNVIDAAIDEGVKRVIGISTDKACVDWHSQIRLADGRTLPISSIVKRREKMSVATLDGEQVTESAVVGWFKNKRAGRAMIHLSYHGATGRSGVWLTADHPVLTDTGWRKAGEVAEGDMLVTAEPAPNPNQLAMLVGTLLGDGYLVRTPTGRSRWHLRLGHAAREVEWLQLKIAAAAGLLLASPKTDPPRGRRQAFVRAHSRTMACLGALVRDFYDRTGRKRVPRALFASSFSSAPHVLL